MCAILQELYICSDRHMKTCSDSIRFCKPDSTKCPAGSNFYTALIYTDVTLFNLNLVIFLISYKEAIKVTHFSVLLTVPLSCRHIMRVHTSPVDWWLTMTMASSSEMGRTSSPHSVTARRDKHTDTSWLKRLCK